MVESYSFESRQRSEVMQNPSHCDGLEPLMGGSSPKPPRSFSYDSRSGIHEFTPDSWSLADWVGRV